jgi:hypothetical protein
MLSANGNLSGNVTSATSQIPNAKVSLVSQGKVIDSVTTDDSGNFSFANVNPGPYQIVGSAEGMVGSSFSTSPVASYNTSCGCNTCGGGGLGSRLGLGGGNFGGGLGGGNFGGGLGSGIGSRLGGGLLTSPRGLLLIGGLAGGLASIEDSSPDQ